MKPVEFFHFRKCMVALSDKRAYEFTEADTDMADFLFGKIRTEYSEAFDALCSLYSKSRNNMRFFRFKVVDRFLRCNLSRIDKM